LLDDLAAFRQRLCLLDRRRVGACHDRHGLADEPSLIDAEGNVRRHISSRMQLARRNPRDTCQIQQQCDAARSQFQRAVARMYEQSRSAG
jgi:hypothetical protein